jgi:hypothetical protein
VNTFHRDLSVGVCLVKFQVRTARIYDCVLLQGRRKPTRHGPARNLQEDEAITGQNGRHLQQAGTAAADIPRRRFRTARVPVPIQVPTVELHLVEEEHQEGAPAR